MDIALILQHKLIQGLQQLLGASGGVQLHTGWQSGGSTGAQARATAVPVQVAIEGKATVLGVHPKPHCAQPSRMPLRVFRVIEKDQPLSSTGRMVISGRMADVCAELDRLAAKEAALH